MEKPPPRRSLSASLGSWCISLVHNPGREEYGNATNTPKGFHKERPASEALVLFPAYLAAFIGVAAVCFALSNFVTYGDFSRYLVFLLAGAGITAFGSKCAPCRVQKIFKIGRWVVASLVILLAISIPTSSDFTVGIDGDTNSYVAIFIGLVTIFSFLIIGVRSGGRIIPPNAPLIPCLSLFGMLCLISIDFVVAVCFLVFLFSSLYLLTYDRYLRRVAPEISQGVVGAIPIALWPSLAKVQKWALQSFVIAVVWCLSFFCGGLLLYWPIQAILPNLLSQPISKIRAATRNLQFNYSSSASAMEITGGNYVLSERPVLRITAQEGEPSGLWRGKVYEYYDRSRWEEYSPELQVSWETSTGITPDLQSPLQENKNLFQFRRHLDSVTSWEKSRKLSPEKGRFKNVLELVEPLDSQISVFYASGQFSNWLERPDMSSTDGDPTEIKIPYLVRSFFVEPQWSVLTNTAGYETNLENGKVPLMLRNSLQLPRDNETRRTLSAIARQINIQQQQTPKTPHQKVRAISSYLLENCYYALNSPKVPPTQDSVVFFLTESRAGACDMFASSMVLLLREMNVPARIVSGYIQNDDFSSVTSDSSQRRTYLVKERDAHAWVEYYVPEYGWLPYDPTQGSRQLDSTLPTQIAQLFNVPEFKVPPLLLFMPVVGLSLVFIGLRTATPVQKKTQFGEQQADLQRTIFDAYSKARAALHKRVTFESHLTPSDYENRVNRAPISVEAKQEFAALTHLYLSAKYGQTPEVSAHSVRECLGRLNTALKKQKMK
jgi:hypothetical protein